MGFLSTYLLLALFHVIFKTPKEEVRGINIFGSIVIGLIFAVISFLAGDYPYTLGFIIVGFMAAGLSAFFGPPK